MHMYKKGMKLRNETAARADRKTTKTDPQSPTIKEVEVICTPPTLRESGEKRARDPWYGGHRVVQTYVRDEGKAEDGADAFQLCTERG